MTRIAGECAAEMSRRATPTMKKFLTTGARPRPTRLAARREHQRPENEPFASSELQTIVEPQFTSGMLRCAPRDPRRTATGVAYAQQSGTLPDPCRAERQR